MTKPSLLIVCFSDISKDARVLKQVRAFAEQYSVTTCGFGETPVAGVEHLRADLGQRQPNRGPQRYAKGALDLAARAFGWWNWTYRQIPHVVRARELLRGRKFDAVLANDVDTIPIALELESKGVHADLHEFFPGIYDSATSAGRKQTAYLTWLVKRYASRAISATTVAAGLAEAYRDYRIECEVVTNATPRFELSPQSVRRPIKLVHSGVAQPSRQLELTMEAVAASSADVTLDLYLMPNDVVYLAELVKLAKRIGPRVTIHDPLPQSELVTGLNSYDVGIFVLPPTSFNNANALPNKFFDFVQARLGLLIGPTPEMAKILNEYGIGAVTTDFSIVSIRAAIDALDEETVAEWKQRSDAASVPLSADVQVAVWGRAIDRILAR
ncbi:glycosyltransferase family 1 protein [uncultured Salinibacterium sp.]|uniref:glycosyltransferase family 1 protein n=1 Tax=uncultured Salinibacterium sp. TaxID=459274 RepID=UPI0030DD2EA6|tara:strand:+ start:26022 stop:27173 length:1152 start_codon:yes stop_codon:yes gene_type:complete